MTITLASFYVHRPNHPMSRSYDKMLDLQRRSCERWGVEHIVLTDWNWHAKSPSADFHSDLPENLMEASLTAQRNYLEQGHYDKLILCDADVVLGKDPTSLFLNGNFDVAVTVHPFVDSILNNGAIFVSNGRLNGFVTNYWDKAIDTFQSYSDGIKQWGGDQQALRDAFQASLAIGYHVDSDGVIISQFPCDGYNEAPDNVNHDIRPYCVHFRGTRKEWAEEWTKNFLQL